MRLVKVLTHRAIKGDALRQKVLSSLEDRPGSYEDLAIQLGVARSTVEFHLRELELQGMVERTGSRGSGAAGRPRILFQAVKISPRTQAPSKSASPCRDPLLRAFYGQVAP